MFDIRRFYVRRFDVRRADVPTFGVGRSMFRVSQGYGGQVRVRRSAFVELQAAGYRLQ
jgi:hypothetical protein